MLLLDLRLVLLNVEVLDQNTLNHFCLDSGFQARPNALVEGFVKYQVVRTVSAISKTSTARDKSVGIVRISVISILPEPAEHCRKKGKKNKECS